MNKKNLKSFVLALAFLPTAYLFFMGIRDLRKESPEDVVTYEASKEEYYTVILPFCSSPTVLMLDQEGVTIWCEDRADFQIEIGEDLVEKIEAIQGISNVRVTPNVAYIEQDGNHYWFPLLQEAAPILMAALKENQ